VVELSHDTRPIIGQGPPLGAAFIALALLSIALMVADHRYQQLDRVRGWLGAAAYPVQRAIDLPFRAWDWLTGSFADRSRLRRENLELSTRLRLANLQLQRFAALEDENRRLRDMRENTAGVAERVLVASILNVDLDPFRHRVLLDKGARDGVFKGQAVLDGEGIFGQVWRVGELTSEVILISDAEHAIPVASNRSGIRSIAVGTGDSERLSLPFVTAEADLKTEDLLISTGLGGVFPPGYPVARITRVERAASATFAIVEARPTARLALDREVLLVRSPHGRPWVSLAGRPRARRAQGDCPRPARARIPGGRVPHAPPAAADAHVPAAAPGDRRDAAAGHLSLPDLLDRRTDGPWLHERVAVAAGALRRAAVATDRGIGRHAGPPVAVNMRVTR
jgi:rod shape-determining protein MreC